MIQKKELGIENKKHMLNLIHLCYRGGLTDLNGYPAELLSNKCDKNVLQKISQS
jgi:hypothetical protein